ncbi:MAG: hypothetical protein WAM88_13095 [Nitrososphaeraceae archaeon]
MAKSSNRVISSCITFFCIIVFGSLSNASTLAFSMPIAEATTEKNNQVMLGAVLTDLGDPNRWQTALEELGKRHTDLDI